MSLEVTYKGQQIAQLTEDGSLTLNTAGTYCEDNIDLTYSGGGGGGGTTEVPQKWQRPSDWPNLDLIDVSAPMAVNTAYVTIFCDGTWQYLLSNSSLDDSAAEIELTSDGSERVIQTLPVNTIQHKVDISQLSNGIHLVKITGTTSGLYLLNAPAVEAHQQKTLESLIIGCGSGTTRAVTLNTGSYRDWLCGTSPTAQRVAAYWLGSNSFDNIMVGILSECVSLKRAELHHCKNFANMRIYTYTRYSGQLIELILDDCTGASGVYGAPSLQYDTLLETLDTAGIDFSALRPTENITGINQYCYNLVNFGGLPGAPCNQTYANCTKLSHQSLLNIIDALPTVTDTKTLTLGAVNKAKLTADEIAVAEAKGWTVS